MAKKKISQLTPATALTGSEILPVVQAGTTKSATPTQISELIRTDSLTEVGALVVEANASAASAASAAAVATTAATTATDAAMASHLATIEASEDAAAASATQAAASADAAESSASTAQLAAASGAVKGYETKALMDADLAHDDGTLALVTNDPTAANNGTYRKSGASGSGSWVLSADRVTGLEADVAALETNDTLKSALWNVAWLAPAALSESWSGPYWTEVAKAIKAVQLHDADPDRVYRIIVFQVDDGGAAPDRIIIQDDLGATYMDVLAADFSPSTTAITKIEKTYLGNRATLWIDYREITHTGVLVNSASSPLIMARTSAQTVINADRASQADMESVQSTLASAQISPYANASVNPTLDPSGAAVEIFIGGGAVTYKAPYTTELAAKGVSRVVDMQDYGPETFRYKVEALDESAASKYVYAAVYVESGTGANWPTSVEIIPYAGSTQYSMTGVTTGYDVVTSNLRRYWRKGRMQARTDLTHLRMGFATIAADVRMGGFTLVLDEAAIDTTALLPDYWYDVRLTAVALGALQERVDVLDGDTGLRGSTIAYFGDSITESYGVPEAVGSLLGATVLNFGFGGCRMAAHPTSYYDTMSMYRVAEAVASGVFTDMIQGADDLYTNVGDDNRAIVAALAAQDFSEVDVVVIAYGTNDWSAGVDVGTASDTTGATLLGAMNVTVSELLTAYPHLQVVFIAPMWRGSGATFGDTDVNPNGDGVYLYDYADAIIERANAHHLPAFDMYRNSGINQYNKALYLADDLHPTQPVGRERLASRIAAFLRSKM